MPSIGCIAKTLRVNVGNTVSFKHQMGTCKTPQRGPTRVAFFAAGFSFARGHRILRVPYDWHAPYIFDGEEMSLGVRAWTWGYDLYPRPRRRNPVSTVAASAEYPRRGRGVAATRLHGRPPRKNT